jgi:hypothetical protein
MKALSPAPRAQLLLARTLGLTPQALCFHLLRRFAGRWDERLYENNLSFQTSLQRAAY